MLKIYIEETPASELKSLILSNDELQFKHKDNAMVFTSDGHFLYAKDVDDESCLFRDGEFAAAIMDHYGELDSVIDLLESLEEFGMPLELADAVNNHSFTLKELMERKVSGKALVKELCLLLAEECSEVSQRASKLSRFGHREVQAGQSHDNYERLRIEKVDMLVVYHLLTVATGRVDFGLPDTQTPEWHAKQDKIIESAHLSVELGELDENVMAALCACVRRARVAPVMEKEKPAIDVNPFIGRDITTANGPASLGKYDPVKGKHTVYYNNGGIGYLGDKDFAFV